MTLAPPQVPTIETARLILRGHRADDFAASAAMWAEPGVYRHIGGKPSTPQQAWARLLTYVGHWALLGFGYWAVEERATGDFVGELGFADFKREIEPKIAGRPELGWALATSAHGRGYATEALRAVLDWGARQLAAEETVCIVDPQNAASLRVAEKLGFRELARTTYAGAPTIMLARRLKP